MERHLELGRPAADDPAADLALGLQTCRWVLEGPAVEPSLDAGSRGEHHDRVQVDLAESSLKHDPGRALVRDDVISEIRKRFDRRFDGVARNAYVDVAMIARLPAQQGIDAPAAGYARTDTGRLEGVKHTQDFGSIHDWVSPATHADQRQSRVHPIRRSFGPRVPNRNEGCESRRNGDWRASTARLGPSRSRARSSASCPEAILR